MKMKIFYLTTAIFMLFVSSCTSEYDEVAYSCNPEINDWAKQNLSEIQTMSRSEWLYIDNPSYQRAALVAFTPEQKYKFWLLKMEEVLELSWKPEETAHIKDVIELLHRNSFIFQDNYSDENRKQYDIELYQWVEKAKKELGWSDLLIAALIADGNRVVDTKGTLDISMVKNTLKKTRAEAECDCNLDNVLWTTCGGLFGGSCERYSCEKTIEGCGAFGREECDGICYDPI